MRHARIPLLFLCPLLLSTVLPHTFGEEQAVSRLFDLPGIFSDNMVLQRDVPVAVWGTAAPGVTVTVRFQDQVKRAVATSEGTWRIVLDPLVAPKNQSGYELTVRADREIVFKNVLIGEVWLGAGQSNMAYPILSFADSEKTLAQANSRRLLRLSSCTVSPNYWTPGTGWVMSSENTAKRFSGLLYHFGVKLQEELDVPVGLIARAVSGSPSLPFVSREAFLADEGCRREFGGPSAELPPVPKVVGATYEEMIAPIAGYTIRGMIWDQGESGSGDGRIQLKTSFAALAASWRNEWKCGAFPFIYVQKPSGGGWNWRPDMKDKNGTAVPAPTLPDEAFLADGGQHRAALSRIQFAGYADAIPNSAMCIAVDLDGGIHPFNKTAYAHRLVTIALGKVYGLDVTYYGPTYESHRVEGGVVKIRFRNAGRGLVARNPPAITGFAVAGKDKVFHWADAEIHGNEVWVRSEKVAAPVAVRYAWSGAPSWANLFNADGFPALTFRTDDW